MVVNFYQLHYNPSEWQRPNEFLPQRFDPTDALYLTPSGKKRNAYSFTPFNGGKRICFGKTFAESTMKVVATYMTQFFNFELLDEKYKDERVYPTAHLGMSKNPSTLVKLTENK